MRKQGNRKGRAVQVAAGMEGAAVGDRTGAKEAAIVFLTELFSSRVRALLLAFLVARHDQGFSLTELSRALESPISSLQHECYKLERLGLLQGRREGASRRYRLVRDARSEPVIHLVETMLGLPAGRPARIREALGDLASLDGALLVGDPAAQPPATLQLILIGELGLEHVQVAQERVAAVLAMPLDRLDVAFFRHEEWQGYRARGHPRVERLRDQPVLLILGTADGLLQR